MDRRDACFSEEEGETGKAARGELSVAFANGLRSLLENPGSGCDTPLQLQGLPTQVAGATPIRCLVIPLIAVHHRFPRDFFPAMLADPSQVETGEIRTEFVTYQNRAGLRIAACLDHVGGEMRTRPWVLMAPKFGETKKTTLQLAYHLVANGLNVLRFDLTNHVGESEGRMLDFVLSGAVDDVVAGLDYLRDNFGVSKVTGVANSLSARCMLRVAVGDRRIGKLICVAGVVNLAATMHEIYKEDIFGKFQTGYRWGITDFLGFDINTDVFLDTVIRSGLHDLPGTLEDAGKLKVPFVFFYAARDVWVRKYEVEQVVAANPHGRLVPVTAAMHEVRENPQAARQVFDQVVWTCLSDDPYPGDPAANLRVPDKRLIMGQNRRERDRMRRLDAPSESETQFWSNYLKKYSILEKSVDYRAYLDLVGRLCGSLRAGALVLDAGCGNGLFGLWVLREVWQRQALAPADEPLIYVGLDLTQRGLADALGNHLGWRQKLHKIAKARAVPPPGLQYFLVDFDRLEEKSSVTERLPFQEGTFDVICCSLVLSYLKHPQGLLRELYRVLRPGGILIVTSLKPNCDLSIIYHDSILENVTPEDVEAGRNLLRAAGKIKLKEEIGYYTFYTQAELAELVMDLGFNVLESHLSLGEQAAVIKAGK
jgi:SAM-dependent methyltransferase/pimeloyl-ACP methyl ester carboxylesterase